ncbi:hypothetical protein [Afipia sp. P52-10]|jgi:hypothetical protein|uniref:hypothetical protein n=1 Tax=Afipia sp. P52-10 TaxID=1429916 RepID=UPI0004BCD07D|nr:hypothetical protein [Afipia sp. P52-10]
MKTLALATAFAAVLAGPALAKSADVQHLRHHHVNATMTDPIGVYANPATEVGRDPDPAIRVELLNEYYDMNAGG